VGRPASPAPRRLLIERAAQPWTHDRGGSWCSGAQIHHDHGTAQTPGHDSWSRRISHPGTPETHRDHDGRLHDLPWFRVLEHGKPWPIMKSGRPGAVSVSRL